MNINSSLDFLNMIKNGTSHGDGSNDLSTSHRDGSSDWLVQDDAGANAKNAAERGLIAVIDTETNWHDQVMSIGVALAEAANYRCVGKRYYILDPEYRVGGMYSSVMRKCETKALFSRREEALADLDKYLLDNGVKKILAYNARFDLGHLPELSGYEWFDIMRIAAYRQYNPFIPDTAECCKTGRLKGKYGVETIMQMITGDSRYRETHNAVIDACDELKIVELMGVGLEVYECGRL